MKETFEKVIAYIHQDEGEYSNDPNDPGGPTRLGITYIDLARHRGIPKKDAWRLVKGMDEAECKEIYKKYYWDLNLCDELPASIDYFIFDSSLHSGYETAAKWLQRSVGASPDGKIGPKTLAAVNDVAPVALLGQLVKRRRDYLKSLKLWRTYSRGWTNRVNKVEKRCKKILGV
jgi:lysozyme family protein